MIIETGIALPQDDASRTAIKKAIGEACDAKLRISAENDLLKDIRTSVKDQYGLAPKHFNMMVKAKYNGDIEKTVAEATEIEASLDILFKPAGAVDEDQNQ